MKTWVVRTDDERKVEILAPSRALAILNYRHAHGFDGIASVYVKRTKREAPAPAPTGGYQAWVVTAGDPKAYTNAIVLPSRAEAEAYGRDLMSRWTLVVSMEVRETPSAPNYMWMGGKLQSLQGGN